MKSGNRRSFLAGMLTALVLMSLVGSAGAFTGKVQKELTYQDISVTLDGKKLDLRDVKGNSVEPFRFDGTNYLPVRALSEALGLSVAWDGTTQTVVLTTPASASATAADKLLAEVNGVKIYYTGLTAASSYLGGWEVNLRIENPTSSNFTVQARNLSVNGYMTDSIFSCDVAAGKKANDAILLSQDALAKNSITSVSAVELKFAVFNSDTWSGSKESDVVTIQCK